MNISYKLKGVKEVKRLYIRLYHNRLDITVGTNIMLLKNQWDSQKEFIIGEPEVNIGLTELKLAVLKQFNKDYVVGVSIEKKWLEKVVKTSFMRPVMEDKLVSPVHTLYLSDFCSYWMENHAGKWKTSSRQFMGSVLKSQYLKFTELLKEYEKVIGEKLLLRRLSVDDINSFVEYQESENYQVSTIKRNISRMKFFLLRASEHNIEVSNAYKQRIYFEKEEELDGVYLNEKEINAIIKKDFSFDPELYIAKQNFLILLNTGMRGGDFMRNLDISKVDNDVIKIKTQKTGQYVVIPLHKTVKDILRSNFGNLPPKMSLFDFNKAIKTICMVCEIDEKVEGKLFDSKKKRKVKGYYPKYKLISSHSARRSFATLYKGKISDEAICSIMGWSSGSKMIQLYNQTTKSEYAKSLSDLWNNK